MSDPEYEVCVWLWCKKGYERVEIRYMAMRVAPKILNPIVFSSWPLPTEMMSSITSPTTPRIAPMPCVTALIISSGTEV